MTEQSTGDVVPERRNAVGPKSSMWMDPAQDPRFAAGAELEGERVRLLDYLRACRLALELKCAGLDAEQLARRSVPPSTMSLLGRRCRRRPGVPLGTRQTLAQGAAGQRLHAAAARRRRPRHGASGSAGPGPRPERPPRRAAPPRPRATGAARQPGQPQAPCPRPRRPGTSRHPSRTPPAADAMTGKPGQVPGVPPQSTRYRNRCRSLAGEADIAEQCGAVHDVERFAGLVAASGAEGRQPQPGQPIQVGDAVHRADPAAGDCDRDERHRPSPDRDQHPGHTVDEHRGEVG